MVTCCAPSALPIWSASQPPSIQANSSDRLQAGHSLASHWSSPDSFHFPVELHDAAELPVGGHLAELAGPVQRQRETEAHRAVLARPVQVLKLAHAPGQTCEQEAGGQVVVPHVGAGAEAGSGLVQASFPAEGPAVGGPEIGLAA